MRSILSALLITFVFVVSPTAAQKRNITEKDLFAFNWIGDPQISPDGSRVAFVRVTVNEKKDGYNTSIWTVSTATGETRQLTSGVRDSSPRWSPDSKYICVGGEDDLVTVWSFKERRVVARGQGHK